MNSILHLNMAIGRLLSYQSLHVSFTLVHLIYWHHLQGCDVPWIGSIFDYRTENLIVPLNMQICDF